MSADRVPLPAASALFKGGADVFYQAETVARFGDAEIAFQKSNAAASSRMRSRLCLHPDPAASIHEMLIVHHRDVYVRPHRNHGKSKSQYAIEGLAYVLFFDDDGALKEALPLGERGSGRLAYYRVPENVWHALLIESEWFTFLEVIGGPFMPEQTEFAPWSPKDFDPAYTAGLREKLGLRSD